MPTYTTRFIAKRITDKIEAGINVLERDAKVEYQHAAGDVAEWWSKGILRSGRGGQHNAAMASIESSVNKTGSGWSIRVGWLGSPPMAADGRTTWYAYQDSGYNAFGRGPFIPGLLLQIDARQRLEIGLRDANERLAMKVKREIRRR